MQDPASRISSLLTSVGEVPLIRHKSADSVWRVLQHVVRLIDFTFFNVSNLLSDLLESIDEAVDFSFVLGLSWLNHKTSDKGPRHRRGVEAIVHQSLSNVFFCDACFLFKFVQVNVKLMGDSALVPSKRYFVVVLKLIRHIVCI